MKLVLNRPPKTHNPGLNEIGVPTAEMPFEVLRNKYKVNDEIEREKTQIFSVLYCCKKND